jgi:nudix-type nucleoside diphosphatase (YffH/AdpP family)
MPVYLNPPPGPAAERGMLIEACAGLLDKNDPETAIRKEAEEELGYRLKSVTRIFDTYMSPGSVSERLSLFLADYSPDDRISAGGGAPSEGEDIEVIELPLTEAVAMVDRGEIIDGKTIMLLQYASLKRQAP